MLQDTLLELDFSANQAKVYKTLVQLGEAKVGDLVTETGFAWNIVNRALQDLVQRKLIYKTSKKGVSSYTASDPKVLIQEYSKKIELAKEVIEQLKDNQTGKPDIMVLTGDQGVLDFLDLLLQTKKDMFVLGVNYFWSKEYQQLYENFEEKFAKKSVKRFVLANPKYKELADSIKASETRFLPKSFPDSPLTISIFDDYTAQIISAKPVVIVVIRNEEIAKGYQDYFKLLWELAK